MREKIIPDMVMLSWLRGEMHWRNPVMLNITPYFHR